MEYLASVENNSYCYWQLELLIESFKRHKLEDKLVIAVAETEESVIQQFVRNFSQHKRVFRHVNYGKEHKSLNALGAACSAINNNLISQPFALLHPDMLLYKPLEETSHNITFSTEMSDIEIETAINEERESILSSIKLDINLLKEIPFGNIVILKDVPQRFYWRVMERIVNAINDYPSFNPTKIAWMLTMCEYLGRLNYKDIFCEVPLVASAIPDNTSFIHYKHGLPPIFHKRFFTYRNEFAHLSTGLNPYQSLLENNPTPVTNYMQEIILSYLSQA